LGSIISKQQWSAAGQGAAVSNRRQWDEFHTPQRASAATNMKHIPCEADQLP